LNTVVPQLVLASRSPRRSDLLKSMGFSFIVVSAPVSEENLDIEDPKLLTIELSKRKAGAVLEQYAEGIVIGADTVVCLDGQIFGKPADREEASTMLHTLSGKTHQVFTGFTLNYIGHRQISGVEKTEVTFRKLQQWEIDDYVRTDKPLDKAGAYGIQDESGLFVDHIEGCFYNVVGFPLTRFYEALKELLEIKVLRAMMHFS